MTFTKCPNCDRDVSDSAASCSSCGHAIRNAGEMYHRSSSPLAGVSAPRRSAARKLGRDVRRLYDRGLETAGRVTIRLLGLSTLGEFARRHGRVIVEIVLVVALIGVSLVRDGTSPQPINPSEASGAASSIDASQEQRLAAIRAQATLDYWRNLNAIIASLDNAPEEPKGLEEIASACKQGAETFGEIANQITKLPVANVDEELVAHADEAARVFNDLSFLATETANWATRSKHLKDHSESLPTMVESFLRGLRGDPFGKYNELKEKIAEMEEEQMALGQRRTSLMRTLVDLRSKDNRLRSVLSQRYGQEF